MFKKGLGEYGRLLLTVVFISLVALLSGCCELCDLDKCCPKLNCENCEPDCTKCPAQPAPPNDCKYCDMAVVYAFNIPEAPEDCPESTSYIANTDAAIAVGLKIHDGGAGIIDRSGGAGIVDREGQVVASFCLVDCKTDENGNEIQKHVGYARTVWAYESDFLVADSVCQ